MLIIALIAGTASFYVGGLGLYTDDWPYWLEVKAGAQQSLGALYAAISSPANAAVRPLQLLLYMFYGRAAPDSILFAHVFNQAMFATAALIILFALHRLPRIAREAYPIVLIYVCLPHYFTERLWYANHQSTLSLLLFAICFYLMIELRRRTGFVRLGFLAVLMLCFAAALFAYEVYGVVMLAAPLFIARAERLPWRALPRDAAWLQTTAAVSLVFVLAALFKIQVGSSLIFHYSLLDHVKATIDLYHRAAKTDLWTLGVGSPITAWRLAHGPFFAVQAVVAAVLGGALVLVGERMNPPPDAPLGTIALLGGAGGTVFILGYIPFLANFFYGEAPFGIDNRCNVAAAMGLAFLGVAAARLLGRASAIAGSAAIVACCVLGIFFQVTLGITWDKAYVIEEALYARILKAVGRPERGETVLLYGTCPYYGPVPLFGVSWGLAERLGFDTHTPSLQADTVTPEMRISAKGLAMADDNLVSYRTLRIFDAKTGMLYSIESYEDAQLFFMSHPISQSTGCISANYSGQPMYR